MASQKLVIADGHHRYETALAYRDERRAKAAGDRNAPYEKAMMTFFNTHGEGLLILPTHRLVANLPSFDPASFRRKISPAFDEEDYAFGSEAARGPVCERFQRDLLASGKTGRAFGMYAGGGSFTLLRLRSDADLQKLMPGLSAAQRKLDVVLLHQVLLQNGLGITPAAVTAEQNISYEREMGAALDAVDRKRAQICFLLNPVDVGQVMDIALAGEVLPQKSTDFYPKLLSGLTLYRLD
jgi:uncharacterized protein (DUF1015 family)